MKYSFLALLLVFSSSAAQAIEAESCRTLADQYRREFADHGQKDYEQWNRQWILARKTGGALDHFMDAMPVATRATLKDYLAGLITDRAAVRGALNDVAAKVQAEGVFARTSCDTYTNADPSDTRTYTREGDVNDELRNCVAPKEPTAPSPPLTGCWSGSCHPFTGWHWTAWGPVHSDATFVPWRYPALDAGVRVTDELTIRACQSRSPDGVQNIRTCYDLSAADLRDRRSPATAEIMKRNNLPEWVPGTAPEYVQAHLGELYGPCLALGALARAPDAHNQNEAVASFAGPNAGREDKLEFPSSAPAGGATPEKTATANAAI